jgi:hypothetical protein
MRKDKVDLLIILLVFSVERLGHILVVSIVEPMVAQHIIRLSDRFGILVIV